LKGEWYACAAAMIIMVFLIIQIERQIILSTKDNRVLYVFRSIIALAMAMIGTLIIDQIIFKEDIDKRKLLSIDREVDVVLPGRSKELIKQIQQIDSTIQVKEAERKKITDDLTNRPYITLIETIKEVDSAGHETVKVVKRKELNPNVSLLAPLENSVVALRMQKAKKDSTHLTLRPAIEKELRENVGFLDELKVMYSLLSESGVSFSAWFIWFVFLLGLELLILASKVGETENDYDKMMDQQMQLHLLKIHLLTKRSLDV
jgi:hypothetical protein